MLLALLSLNGCATTTSKTIQPNPVLPAYPIAGKSVAGELSVVCFSKQGPLCPATFEWLGRIDKLRDKLPVSK